MNDKNDMTSQPGPGTTHRGEPTPPASRFTTSLLLQSSGGAKAILSNLKDLLTMRAPKFAHSSPATRTITLKDENFSRSQVASFALHGSLALLLFMTFVTRLPISRRCRPCTTAHFRATSRVYLRQTARTSRPSPGNRGGGSGGERSLIPMSVGDRPASRSQQIIAPSVHTFPNSAIADGLRRSRRPDPDARRFQWLPNWGDLKSNTSYELGRSRAVAWEWETTARHRYRRSAKALDPERSRWHWHRSQSALQATASAPRPANIARAPNIPTKPAESTIRAS